jgi:hypothetical protein
MSVNSRVSQRGVSLSGLLVWGFLIVIVAVTGMKVAPEVVEYFKVKKAIAAVAQDGKLSSVTEVQSAFDRYANIDQISVINGKDLEVSKESTGFVVSVSYERRIKMFGPVSVVIAFEASSAK